MTELADTTLVDGRYRIVGRIGSGGMADVYLAEDTHLGREVALKVLHRRFAQDHEFVERFRREASSAAGLQHPNVVGVFDRGEHEGTYYIAMEHLAGRTLKEIVTSEAPLPQEQAIDLGMQILRAAGFAHRRGVIHRDFKPHNVIVDDAGNAKVTDFVEHDCADQDPSDDASEDAVADLLDQKRHAASPVGDVRGDVGRGNGGEQQRHADPVVEATLDVEALADPARHARLRDDRLAERRVCGGQDDAEDGGFPEVSSPKSTAAASAPRAIVKGRPIPSRRTGSEISRRSLPRSIREESEKRTNASVSSASDRTVTLVLGMSTASRNLAPIRSPIETNMIAGVIGVPDKRIETAATASSASATVASAHST